MPVLLVFLDKLPVNKVGEFEVQLAHAIANNEALVSLLKKN